MNPKANPIFLSPLAEPQKPDTTVRISSQQTGGAYCVCEMTMLPGEGVDWHVHDRDEEFYYILEGIFQMQAGEERFAAEAGAMVMIPRDVPHRFRNEGVGPARALMIFRPGGFDELLGEVRQAAAQGTLTGPHRQELMAKRGIHFEKDPRLPKTS